jgi:hypothetical protein
VKESSHSERLIVVKTARQSPLDPVREINQATGCLLDPSGKLSAVVVAKLYGIRTATLAEWLGRSPRFVNRKPNRKCLQAQLEFFARVARLLAVLSPNDFRRWLRRPNSRLEGQTPLAWLANGRWQPLADLVDDMLAGAPS